jgi:hypothetical protein
MKRSVGFAPPQSPPNRGRLWYDFEIPDRFFEGLPGIGCKVRWVRDHLPRATRLKIGKASAWYETDIVAWLESQREANRVRAAVG